MFRVIAVVLALVLLGGAGLKFGLNINPLALGEAVGMATGMGAKLACSGRYLSGLDEQQAMDDLASYSAATRQLNLVYDDDSRTVSADLSGLEATRARYREGLGCTLDIGDTAALDSIDVPRVRANRAPWPRGESVVSIDSELQKNLGQMLQRDNAAGLQTRALVVIEGEELIAEAYADGFDEESMLLGWSMGKSLTAIMAGHLEFPLIDPEGKVVAHGSAREVVPLTKKILAELEREEDEGGSDENGED